MNDKYHIAITDDTALPFRLRLEFARDIRPDITRSGLGGVAESTKKIID